MFDFPYFFLFRFDVLSPLGYSYRAKLTPSTPRFLSAEIGRLKEESIMAQV